MLVLTYALALLSFVRVLRAASASAVPDEERWKTGKFDTHMDESQMAKSFQEMAPGSEKRVASHPVSQRKAKSL